MTIIPNICSNCGSDDLAWTPYLRNASGVVDGRLRMHDVSAGFAYSCNECSETLLVATGEEVADFLNTPQAAPAPGVGEAVAIGSIDPSLLALIRGGRNGTFSGIKIRVGDDMKPGDALLYAAPPAPHGDALTPQERHVIDALLDLAYKAWCLADDSEDIGDSHNVEAADFDALSNALDVLQALPDDQPGYTMGEAAKARWALRRLIGTDAAIAVQAKGGA
ncbi:hypothetical protein [Pseudoxanthomonas winnipegensis]|uniref:Uncharacterized protein n=1 Tax=Pseudoxanthomonas winnipegensis TaxID=2480810 RepID=A0A4Q8L4M3_9GAMM|nr:hypothetical protein [Pseudoxanthomonas winnipegensis]TAA20341.1 hypothetical protein EA660_18300 [Pseudoxanthomonas winnipegensis]